MHTKTSGTQRAAEGTKPSVRHTTFTQPPSSVSMGLEPVNAPLSPNAILQLQRTVGNHSLQRMLGSQKSSSAVPALQRSADGSLSDAEAASAIKYNKARGYTVEVIKQIQQAVGVNDDGVIGKGTVRAIAAWQAQQGLTADGKVGSSTLAKLLPQQPAAELPVAPVESAAESAETAPPPEQGGLISGIVGGLGDMWDTVQEGAASIWDSITDYFGEDTTPAPTEDSTPVEAPPPQPSELDQLMLKERLGIDEIRRARELIDQVTDEKTRGDLYEALQAKVEYHSQRDNESTSGGKNIGDVMCNLTSLAMALSYLGVPNPDPTKQYEDALEDIRVAKKLPARTTSEGWGGVAKELGVTAEFLGYNLTKDKDWYMANVDPKLREGYAVMMSISGHIVRMQDVTENGLVIDDPYGVVNLQAGEGWSYDKDNKNAREGEGTNRGEDSVWAWDAVKVHNMRWIAALK